MNLSKEFKAGVIALFAIIGFVILFQFMKGNNLFSTDNIFYAKYDNVEGLAASNAVSINGLKVGQVVEINPITKKDGRIHFVVKLSIDSKFNFSKNSTVEIFEPGLMSGKQVRINLFYGGENAKDGDTLKGKYQLSMLNSLSSQVSPVKDQVSSVLLKLDSTVANINRVVDEQNRREIKMMLATLNQTIAQYKLAGAEAERLISSNQKGVNDVIGNANQVLLTTNSAVDKYKNIDIDKLNETIAEFKESSVKLNKIISGIQNGEGSLGKLTQDEELYNNLTKTSENLNKLVLDLKENPKRYINFSVFGKNNK